MRTAFSIVALTIVLFLIVWRVSDSWVKGEEQVISSFTAESSEFSRVSIGSRTFIPMEVRLTPGGTILWVNDDTSEHTITSNSNLESSGILKPNQEFRLTIPNQGTYYYYCEKNPFLRGKIIVE